MYLKTLQLMNSFCLNNEQQDVVVTHSVKTLCISYNKFI